LLYLSHLPVLLCDRGLVALLDLFGCALQVGLVLVELIRVLREGLLRLLQLLLFHDYVLLQPLRLLVLVINRYLRRQNFPGIKDKVLNGLFLLVALVEVLNGLGVGAVPPRGGIVGRLGAMDRLLILRPPEGLEGGYIAAGPAVA
jgi:hypothetical protein